MTQEIPGVMKLDLEQTTEQLTVLGDQLRAGNFTGTGKLRNGIVGDIENIFGWHEKFSPETPLTNHDRVTWLEKFREDSLTGATATHSDTSPVGWIDGRIAEIKENEVEKWMNERAQSPQPVRENVQTLLDQFESTGREYGEIGTRGFEDGKGKSYSPEDENRRRELFVQRKKIKSKLYNALFKKE